jgi:hypothetical protein
MEALMSIEIAALRSLTVCLPSSSRVYPRMTPTKRAGRSLLALSVDPEETHPFGEGEGDAGD